MKTALSTCVALATVVLVGCYGSRDSNANQGDTADNPISGAAGGGARSDAPSGDPITPPSKGAPPSVPPHPTPNRPPATGGTAGKTGGGSGGCGAFRTPENERTTYIDTDAFSGIGGAGAMLAGTCKRCGWNSYGDMCQALVASVPKIDNPKYGPCWDLSFEFSSCLEVESCVCGGEVPAKCAAIKAKQDACLNGEDADGGVDTTQVWMDVQTKCSFGFQAPANYVNKPVQGTDSCVLEFAASDCTFFADYGAFSGDITQNPGGSNYGVVAAQLDGRDARIAKSTNADHEYWAGLHVPQVSASSPGIKLTLTATCQSEMGQRDALELFNTIHFD